MGGRPILFGFSKERCNIVARRTRLAYVCKCELGRRPVGGVLTKGGRPTGRGASEPGFAAHAGEFTATDSDEWTVEDFFIGSWCLPYD